MSIKWAVGILITLMYLAVGFYPFNWVYRAHTFNNEKAVLTAAGYNFSGPGIACADTSPEWVQKTIDGTPLEIDLEIKAAHLRQFGPARIFTLSKDPYFRNLTIAQEDEDLIVRMRNPETGLNGIPPYVVKGVFSSSSWHRIKVSITTSALRIHVDESTPLYVPLPEKPFSQWDLTYNLALGNELTFDRPWLGSIRRATVRSGKESIEYTLPGMLNVPDRYEVPRKPRPLLQTLLGGSGTGDILDYMINFFGFIPYGLMIIFLNSGRSWVFATILCLVLSLTIETGQLLVVTDRVPSLVDLTLNTLGGMSGAWMGEISLSRCSPRFKVK
ncbi:VanZ family protein [Desulfuromonas sp. TF]|uniref:VanZ family protein n=1 Tax=Desulfuromonas sp. TF TaxID=1232410 RepID=UPI0004192951|nr:VanZ family protein [Desulfuromonas sp. TF]